jgi:hypothetical protein
MKLSLTGNVAKRQKKKNEKWPKMAKKNGRKKTG